MAAPGIIRDLFALEGVAAPPARSVARRLLLECNDRAIVRAVTWYVLSADYLSPARLAEGLRAICRGWGDYYVTSAVTRGSTSPREPDVRRALVVRPASSGRWGRSAVVREGPVREGVAARTATLGHNLAATNRAYATARAMESRHVATIEGDPIDFISVLADAWEEAGFPGLAAHYRALSGGRDPAWRYG